MNIKSIVDKETLHVFAGLPGSGKTTLAAAIVAYDNKTNFPVYSNVRIKGAYFYDCEQHLGKYDISDCDLIIDEASIEYNSREFKTDKNKSIIKIMKKYRHHHIRNIFLFSQSLEDMDITMRRLCEFSYKIKKFLWWSYLRPITVSEEPVNGQIMLYYEYKVGFPLVLYRPRYYKLFDSWEREYLPHYDFELVT